MAYKTPGVYVEEISKLPPSVAQVETAIPAFIGYTELTNYQGQNLVNFPVRIKSMAEFTEIFGGAFPEPFSATFTGDELTSAPVAPAFPYKMYNSLQLYFANGGGPCFIVTVGAYKAAGAKVVNTELSWWINGHQEGG
jgi:phage tail sheath protein FI